MADFSKEDVLDVKEVIMRRLFGEEFRDSAEGRIEGSKVESQIIKEIFGVWNVDNVKEGEGTHANPSITEEPGGPALANGSSMKDSSEEAHERAKSEETSEFDSCQESSSSCAGSSAHNALVARTGLSYMKNLDREKRESDACLQPSKVVLDVTMKDIPYEPVSSTVHLDHEKKGPEYGYPDRTGQPMEFHQEAVPSRVIEPPEQGMLRTCNLLNYQGDMDATGCIVGGLVSNYQCRVQQIEDVKVVVDGKSVASPVSQESFASVLPSTSAHLAPKEISGAIICPKQSAEEPKNLDIVDAAIVFKRPLNRELRCRLESYAHSLLRDAGWKIELRQRNGRCRPAYFFINTEERFSNKALTVAWKACGQKLLASAAEKQPDENGREWWDVDSFWRDMIETMECLDKEAHQPESSVSLLHRWQLLDPFMAIVWIDKKVGTLKAGKGLKAVKSTTFVLGESRRIISQEMSLSRSDNNARNLQNKGLHNVNCLHVGSTGLGSRRKRSNRSSSKSTFVQRGSDFPSSCPNENKNLCIVEETPSLGADGNCGQTNIQSEVQCTADQASQHEGNIVSSISNNLSSKSVYQGFSLVPEESATIAGKMVASETTKSKLKRTAAAPGDGSAKKTRKKSKKISEIGATEEISKDMNSKVRDGNCREEFASSMDYKGDEQLELVCHQKETTSLISELSPECLPQGELFKKQTSIVPHTSRSENINVSENAKILKKPVKPETKPARQSGKWKGDLVILQEDDQGDAFSEGDIENHKSTKRDRKSRRLSSNEFSSVSSKMHKVAPEFNMAYDQLADPKVVVPADNGNVPNETDSEDIILSTASGISPEPGSNQKLIKVNKSEDNKKKGEKKIPRRRIDDDDLLISALINIRNAGSCSKKDFPKAGASQLKALRKLTNQKGRSKLIPRANKDGDNFVDGSIGRRVTLARRTVLCWLIEMGALSLKDVIQYRHPRNNAVLKDGWVTGEGILCQCCTQIFSISEFKAHAGLKQQRPSLNLFVQSGKSFVVCQFEAWSAELKKRKNNSRVLGADGKDENDDTCGICGDGGDLICCDNCPSTYHQTCLSIKDLPEGNWYCTNCVCVTCRGLANGKETSGSLAVLECAQCELKYHSACFAGKLTCQGGTGSGTWLCGESCEEVYLGLRSCVGVANYIDDGFSWTVLRCSHEDRKVCSPKKAALIADCNTKLAIGLNLMEECFQPMVDPRTGIDMIPHVLYNLGSRFTRLNYQGFYAVVLEKGDQLISVASIRLHGATVAEMPLIATCSEHRRQGMCRRLLNAIEKMLTSFKVKMLILSAIPSLVETWTSGFGFKPVEDEEKQQLANVNLMLFPGTTLLTKNLHEASAQESVENTNFCSPAQHSHIGGDLIESADTLTGHQPTENPRSKIDAKSLIPSISDAQVEQISIQQRERQMTSSDDCVLTASLGEHGVVSNAGSYLSITTANINEMDQDFSTNQVVSCQKPVANISVVHSCSGLFAPRATKIELPSNPSNITHDVIIRDVQESTLQNINILTKDNATEAMNGERSIPSEDEVAKKILVDDLLDKNDSFLFDEQAGKGPFSVTTHDEVSNGVPIRYIEESTCQSVDILVESSAAETVNAERKMSILGGEVVRKSVVEVDRNSFVNASLRNDGACISEELALGSSSLAAPNANGMNIQRISNGEGPGDDVSGALEGDFVGRHVVAKGCTAESLEVCHSILHDKGSGSNC